MKAARSQGGIWYLLMLLVGIQGCIHLLQGSDLLCTAILFATLLLALAITRLGGLHDTLIWMTLYFVARYVWIASLVKIILGQPIDSNLNAPIESYFMVLVVFVEIILAIFLVKLIGFRTILFEESKDIAFLRRVSWACFLIGVPVCILTSLNAKEDVDLAGFRIFAENIYPLAIISRVAYISLRHENKRILDGHLLTMLVMSLVLSLMSGTKMLAFDSLVVYVLSTVSIQRTVPVRLVFIGSLVMALFIIVVTPVVNSLRDLAAMNQKTLPERLDEIVYSIRSGYISDQVDEFSINQNMGNNYLAYFGPIGKFAPVADRVALVQIADVIKPGIDLNGQMGLHWIGGAFVRLIPRVLMPDKDMTSMGDYILWHAGVRSRTDRPTFPTIGLIAGSYALVGWTGVLIAPLILSTLFFLAQRLWAGTSAGNFMAIYFFGRHAHYFVELDIVTFLMNIIRTLPIDFLVVYMIFKLCSFGKFRILGPTRTGPCPVGPPRVSAARPGISGLRDEGHQVAGQFRTSADPMILGGLQGDRPSV